MSTFDQDKPLDLSGDIPATARYSDPEYPDTEELEDTGIYRDGTTLVVMIGTDLPPICVKTNEPAQQTLVRQLTWHPPLLYLTIFAGLLPYAILALLVSYKAKLHIPLSPAVLQKRRRWMAAATGMLVLSIGLIALAIAFASDMDRANDATAGKLAIAGGLLLLIDAFVAVYISSMIVQPTRITRDCVWLKGVSPQYLARFPKY